MASTVRQEFISSLEREFGRLQCIGTGNSLFAIGDKARVYVRYSKVHEKGSTFFGLRREDFALSDGQFKAHIYGNEEGTDLHVVRGGRFGVDAHFGLRNLRVAVLHRGEEPLPTNFSHHQMQTIVGFIGRLTGHAIYIPVNDRPFLDWDIVERFELADETPSTGRFAPAASLVLIDVLWIHPTRNLLAAAFEVEHTTPIYSGLLRLNDIHIDFKLPRAGIVADAEREEAFLRQINRRTFRASGLDEVCLFYKYSDIYRWYLRLRSAGRS